MIKTSTKSNSTLVMHVKDGSKSKNLLPYAISRFQAVECNKIVWQSNLGTVSRTISFVEQFKQQIASSSQSIADNSTTNSIANDDTTSTNNLTNIFQQTRLSYERVVRRPKEVPDIEYEEMIPCIEISLLKTRPQSSTTDHYQTISLLEAGGASTSSTFSTLLSCKGDPPPQPFKKELSRRRLQPLKRVKRDGDNRPGGSTGGKGGGKKKKAKYSTTANESLLPTTPPPPRFKSIA